MLEEAKKIASPGAEPVHKIRRSPRKREVKKDSKKTKGLFYKILLKFIALFRCLGIAQFI